VNSHTRGNRYYSEEFEVRGRTFWRWAIVIGLVLTGSHTVAFFGGGVYAVKQVTTITGAQLRRGSPEPTVASAPAPTKSKPVKSKE
jgi:hypothetical protein